MTNSFEDWIEILKILAPVFGVMAICLFQAYSLQNTGCIFLEKIGFHLDGKTKKQLKWFIFQILFSFVLFIKLIYLVFYRI
jgi:hypothetical protein